MVKAAGWSTQAVYVNRAEPRWISDEQAYPGLQLKLIGRNLDAGEYNAARGTRVRLVPLDRNRPHVITPDAINPFCVDFTVPRNLSTTALALPFCQALPTRYKHLL